MTVTNSSISTSPPTMWKPLLPGAWSSAPNGPIPSRVRPGSFFSIRPVIRSASPTPRTGAEEPALRVLPRARCSGRNRDRRRGCMDENLSLAPVTTQFGLSTPLGAAASVMLRPIPSFTVLTTFVRTSERAVRRTSAGPGCGPAWSEDSNASSHSSTVTVSPRGSKSAMKPLPEYALTRTFIRCPAIGSADRDPAAVGFWERRKRLRVRALSTVHQNGWRSFLEPPHPHRGACAGKRRAPRRR